MRKTKLFIKIICVLILILSTALLSACSASTSDSTGKYVVLIGEDSEITEKLSDIDLLVIDAEYFSQNDIARLRENGVREIYSYINIGSIESFRSYDTDFEKYTLGAYENWPEEKWIDVSAPEWQACTASRVDALVQKGVDGFFIDNCDVYYYAPKKDIFEGLTVILKNIRSLGKAVIINGGDTYVTAYQERYGSAEDIMTGVNQETVWSSIDFDTGTFHAQAEEERDYFCNYLKACKADGMEVYLLEYTTDWKMIRKIKRYCKKEGFHFYIADSLELEQ